jgi:hypothetical protein
MRFGAKAPRGSVWLGHSATIHSHFLITAQAVSLLPPQFCRAANLRFAYSPCKTFLIAAPAVPIQPERYAKFFLKFTVLTKSKKMLYLFRKTIYWRNKMKMKFFTLVFLLAIFVSSVFSNTPEGIEMITFMEYSDGKFYSQFVDLFNKEYGIAGFDSNIIPKQTKDLLISKIPSMHRTYSIVIMSYWLDYNTAIERNRNGQFLTVFYFNRDGEYVSSSWKIAS